MTDRNVQDPRLTRARPSRASLDITETSRFELGGAMESGQNINREDETAVASQKEDGRDSNDHSPTVKSSSSWAPRMVQEMIRKWRTPNPSTPSRRSTPKDFKKRVFHEKLKDYPMGYPMFSAWINSDPNYMMYRKFGQLHHRVMLHKQNELCGLWEKLQSLDFEHADREPDEPNRLVSLEEDNRGSPSAKFGMRAALIENINGKLKDYDDLLFRVMHLQKLKRPSKRNWYSMWNWLDNEAPLVDQEKNFVYHGRDFVHLGKEGENSRADEAVEKLFTYLDSPFLKKLFQRKDQEEISNGIDEHYYSKFRVGLLSATIAMFWLITCIAIPVVFLFEVTSSDLAKICVVLGFTLVFPTVIQTFTRIERQQVFATTVAYCAVLVVFLGNLVNCKNGETPQGI